MLFNSYQFFLFFPVVTVLYFAVPHRYRWVLLLLASCIFYAAFIPAYLLILFFLIIVDYVAGRLIEKSAGRRRWYLLLVSILANGGTLFFFKYFNFFNENLSALANVFHIAYPIGALAIALPIGLSFHTFQSLSYVIEVYRGKYPAERHLGIYALYVMFYPQLVAGPIERPAQLLPQLHEHHAVDYGRITLGLRRMLWGLFKKMVIADNLALYVNLAYGSPESTPGLALFIGTIFFAIQIYCDFSGYTDIALGAAQVMGIKLVENFTIPYAATTITEFWRRWHISLSSWVRDYLFTPLSLSWRGFGVWGIVASLLASFLFIGLWHGAAWVFVIFGLLHAAALSIEFLSARARARLARHLPAAVVAALGRAYVFFFWCATLVFFRSGSLSAALTILAKSVDGVRDTVFSLAGVIHPAVFFKAVVQPVLLIQGSRLSFLFLCVLCLIIACTDYIDFRSGLFKTFSRFSAPVRFLAYIALAFTIMNFGVTQEIPFIYFQF